MRNDITLRVEKALALVVADVQRQGLTTRQYSTRYDPLWQQESYLNENIIAISYGGHKFSVSKDDSFGAITAEIASRIQDDIIDDNATGWPMLPGHHRPMKAKNMDDNTAWWCDGDKPVIPIGQLND